jgi:citrate synthase
LRSEPAPDRPRGRRYYREDIERLRERKEARRDPSKAAALGLHWGSPVLESAITLIDGGKLYYRGHDAIELARQASLEEVAERLWAVEPGERIFDQPPPAWRLPAHRGVAPLARLQVALPIAAAADLAAYDLRPAAVRSAGARILRGAACVVSGGHPKGRIHEALAAAWSTKNSAAADVIRSALVLSADHELNVSAFVSRCAASAGASPYDAVTSALATLKGHRHGGATERVAALFQEIGIPERARDVMAGRLRRGESLPGFGHPLYPAGDPRATPLLQLAAEGGNLRERRLAAEIANAASELVHDRPNLDFGLVALSRAWRFPPEAPFLLFALARIVGWIAHAIEQYASNQLIRPRARYTGTLPVIR